MFDSLKNWLFHDDQDDFEKFRAKSKQQKIKLPSDFAQQILDLELELEDDNVNEKMVNQLLGLYKLGTEYYEQNHDRKYRIFAQKSSQLLMRPNVLKAIKPVQKEEIILQEKDAIQTAKAFSEDRSLMDSMINKELQKQQDSIQKRQEDRKKLKQLNK